MPHAVQRYWLRRTIFDPVEGASNPEHGLYQDALLELPSAHLLVRPFTLPAGMYNGLDTEKRICFGEPDFYPLSDYAAFTIVWRNLRFDTLIAAFHYESFRDSAPITASNIQTARSPYEACEIAHFNAADRRPDWGTLAVRAMRTIKREKARQHEYIRSVLLASANRELIDNIWKDNFWGAGHDGNGKNISGKLWMEFRAELRKREEDRQKSLS